MFGEGNGTPLQYCCLENPVDGEAWWAAVHGVSKGRTWLSDFTFTFHFHTLEKEMATQSSVLAWRIPGTGEPGGLPSMESHRVGHDWSDLAIAIVICYRLLLSSLWNLGMFLGRQNPAVHTGAGLHFWDWVLGEVERNSFIALPGKRGHSRLMPSNLYVSTWGR